VILFLFSLDSTTAKKTILKNKS